MNFCVFSQLKGGSLGFLSIALHGNHTPVSPFSYSPGD